jgi:hypothetical protein
MHRSSRILPIWIYRIATTARIMANQKKLNLNGIDIKIEGSMDAGATSITLAVAYPYRTRQKVKSAPCNWICPLQGVLFPQ